MVGYHSPHQAVGAFAGHHVLAEFDGIDPRLLDDLTFLRVSLERALDRAGATVCEVVAKRFTPQGVTVLALLTESHASLHTYPEVGSAFADVFTCGTHARPRLAIQLLAEDLGATDTRITSIHRGRPTVSSGGAAEAGRR